VPCKVVDVGTFTAVVALFKVELSGGKNSLTRFVYSFLHFIIYSKNTPTDTIIINMTREKLDVVQQATKENCGNNTEISCARWNLMN
jgi:hypothetical protein